MITDVIYLKYVEAVQAVAQERLDWGCVRLALRLAVGEAYAAGQAQTSDLAGLQAQLAQMDADNAALALRLRLLAGVQDEAARLRSEVTDLREQVIPDYERQLEVASAEAARLREQLRDAQGDADRLTRLNTIATDTFNSLLEPRSDGEASAVDPTPAAALITPAWGSDHAAWRALPATDRDVVERLEGGQVTFRTLSQSLRRDLVVAVIRSLAQDGKLTMFEFDVAKPAWMGQASGLVALVPDRKWPSLLALALEKK